MIIKYVYTLFVGILLAIFVGVGIAAFYPEPKYPEYPQSMKYPRPALETKEATPSSIQIKDQNEFERLSEEYQDKINDYNKNVSSIAVGSAILMLIISLTLLKQILVIADGLMLGGVLTLLYSIARGFQSGDHMFRFFVVSVGLLVALILGYLKFVRTSLKK